MPRIHVTQAELAASLQAAPAARKRMQQAALGLLQRLQRHARRGSGVLTDVLGRAQAFEEWAHYPVRDAIDAHSGYRFYYHAHAAAERMPGEHGHFHVFGPAPQRRGQPDYTHLVGISVDARGFPLRVFTTNLWVTAEQWLPAEKIVRSLRRLDLSHARPASVAGWVEEVVRLFTPQIDAVVHARDAAITARARGGDATRVLQDRRTHIVTQCRVDLPAQLRVMQSVATP